MEQAKKEAERLFKEEEEAVEAGHIALTISVSSDLNDLLFRVSASCNCWIVYRSLGACGD